MADYVFQADPNFNRVILEDIERRLRTKSL